jgi:hypothetical protein
MGKALVCSQENRNHSIQINVRDKNTEKDNFGDMEEVKEDIYIGIGIKRMKGYRCNLKVDELNKLREHFWEVKTNSKNNNWLVWNTIKRAVSFDELRASLLLEEYGIKTVDGCINNLIDSKGNHYKIPNYCINDPCFEKIETDEKGVEEEKIKLKFYGYKTFEIEVSNKLKGKDLKEEIKSKEQIRDEKTIRLFYRGTEIKDDDFLYKHDLNKNIQVMLLVQ